MPDQKLWTKRAKFTYCIHTINCCMSNSYFGIGGLLIHFFNPVQEPKQQGGCMLDMYSTGKNCHHKGGPCYTHPQCLLTEEGRATGAVCPGPPVYRGPQFKGAPKLCLTRSNKIQFIVHIPVQLL